MVDHAPEPPPPPGDLRPAPAATPSAVTPPPTTQPEPLDQTTPAELVPQPKQWERFAWYGGSAILSLLLVYAGLRLDRADLRAPFYYDLDALLMLPLVKATVEHGFGGHWYNEKMGAPGVMELYDFPVIDHLHFLIVWFLGQFVSNLVLLYNTYFLLTFPLTVLTAMIAFRHLGLTLPAAAVGGLLYSFLPYHYQRWENHYFLAAYWMIPLSLLPAFAICRGNLPFFTRQPDGTYARRLRTWGAVGLVALAAATASAGAYYAFFVCAITAFAGVYGWVVCRTWRAAASAGGVIALIVAFGLINHLPTFIYQAKYDRNLVTERLPEEADHYGLKITHLLLPTDDHNFRPFRTIKEIYNGAGRPAETENRSASLGLVAGAGFVGLVVMLVLPFRRVWPYGPLAGMVVFIALLATIGGFGSIFNLLVSGQIRGYNRVSVVLAFPCLLAALWAIDRFLLTRTSPRARRLRYPAWVAVLVVGFLDQTPFAWFRESGIVKTIDEAAERYRGDAVFFAKIAERMPEGSKIFCLPYAGFPEVPPVYRMRAYEHARGYIFTDSLVWSYGAMKEREADAWQREVASKTMIPDPDKLGTGVEEFLHRIVYRGFDGVLIDMRGYPPLQNGSRAVAIIAEINALYASRVKNRTNQFNAKLPDIPHEDGQQFFIDLRPYREELRALLNKHGPGPFEAKEKEEQERLSVIWLGGFFSPMTETGEFHQLRYGRPSGTMWIINPTDRTRRVKMRMVFGVETSGSFEFVLSGLVTEEFQVQRKAGEWNDKRYGVPKEYVLEVPPGRHPIRIRCDTPPGFVPSDARKLSYYIMDFHSDEVP